MSSSSTKTPYLITYEELFDALREEGIFAKNGGEIISNYVSSKYPHLVYSVEQKEDLDRKFSNFLKTTRSFWKKSGYNYSFFRTKHNKWLANQIIVQETTPASGGRPTSTFTLSSRTTRKRKIKDVVEQHTLDELVFATSSKLRKCGKRDAANLLRELVASPNKATKIKKVYRKTLTEEPVQMLSPEEALSLFVSLQLTKFQYSLIRKSALTKKVKLYPSYRAVLEAKKSCYPPGIEVDAVRADIRLESNVDFTIKRFFKIPNEELFSYVSENNVNELQYIVKWGCDGCGGLSRYKQRCDANEDDSSILASAFVPLQLCTVSEKEENRIILWQNPRTSSPRFCRPISIRFVKETTEEIVKEISDIESQISQLVPTEVDVCGKIVRIIPKFLLTMVDGKVCNALSSNSSTQKCYICGATPKTMNLLEARQINEETVSWGLSPLHAHIRFMECILHISYRLEVPKWMARLNEKEKLIVETKKKKVISDFRSLTGLLLDTPKQGGGNTNDGNTARRFFADPMICSQITGVDETLIRRFGVILKALACGQHINTTSFEQYASDTAKLYVRLYQWYPMPVTVHKILIHSSVTIEKHIIPIGQLSEDAIEMQHKFFKRFRENHSRKISRTATNTDIFQRLLISTDPLITSMGHLPPPKDKTKLPKEVKALLTDQGEMDNSTDEESEQFEDDSDDLGVSSLEL